MGSVRSIGIKRHNGDIEMTSDYLKPFVDGTVALMSTMLDLSCTNSELIVDTKDVYISGAIRMSGHAQGQVALSFPKDVAKRLVARLLKMDERGINDEVLQDGVGELVNIVAGNAKAALSETKYQFNISLPTIVVGQHHHIALFRGLQKDICGLNTEMGSFNLVLWLVAGPVQS